MSERTELPMREERCETCRFWDNESKQMRISEHGGESGACRRLPPVVSGLYCESLQLHAAGRSRDEIEPHHAIDGVFPHTSKDDWCGEWKPKPPDAPTVS